MLRLAAAQYVALQDQAIARAVPPLAARLRQEFADQLPGAGMADKLEGKLFAGLKRAAALGLTTEGELGLFVDAMALLGSEFDLRLDWARTILEDARLTNHEKCVLLRNHLVFARTSAG